MIDLLIGAGIALVCTVVGYEMGRKSLSNKSLFRVRRKREGESDDKKREYLDQRL